MEEKISVLKIFRYDPMKDEKPRFDTFKVPYSEGDRILDLLLYIQENVDPTLAFRWSCNVDSCMVCYIDANGKLVRPCNTQAEENMTLKPRRKCRVVRDLVVDVKLA
ncbi:MAG: hypothetical protein GTN80_09495 [Nitrososphaeria archaeon]|nr:hypothetical protein [Nitrososphaeria archaeon]NIN53089.1 hypothetical protein [Nitrososphaeria archaeon]NIQ33855.1 hypothetical protein [Nitrososphaeria archaeon]